MLARLFGAALMALALAGCVTTGATSTAATGSTSATVTTSVDAKVAAVSAQLARNCAVLQTAVALGQAFSHSARLDKTLAGAQAALASFCSAPPSDVNSAISAVAGAAIAVNQALATKS